MEIKHHHVQWGENFKQKIYLKNKVVSIISIFLRNIFSFTVDSFHSYIQTKKNDNKIKLQQFEIFNPNRKLHPFWVKITVSAQVDHHIRMFNLPVYPLGTTLTMGIIVDDSDTCSKPISRAILPTSFSCTSYLKKSSSFYKIILHF